MRLVVFALCPSLGLAATWTVGDGADYATIQEALDIAAAGDTIEVAAGTYLESLTVPVDVSIVGVDGAESTVLQSDGVAITASGVALVVSGLAVEGAERGLFVSGGSLVLEQSIVQDASIEEGGAGARLIDAAATVEAVTFRSNRVGGENGGHLFASGGSLSIAESRFEGGRAERGGAIYTYGTVVEIRGSTFEGNAVRQTTDASRGGAIRAELSSLFVEDCTFDGNEASTGFGGHIAIFGGEAEIVGGLFVNGEADTYYGGAISASTAELLIDGTRFESNLSLLVSGEGRGYGGALYIDGESEFYVRNATFFGNVAEQYGGAVRVVGGTGVFEATVFEANSAAYGGGLHIATGEDVEVVRSQFLLNDAGNGGAIRWRPNGPGELIIRETEFSENTADGYGGAFYGRSGSQLTLVDSNFVSNTSDVGGALMNWDLDSVQATRNLFCRNEARSNSQSDGGAVASFQSGSGGTNQYINNRFVENRADEYGGALSFLLDENASAVNNTFVTNRGDTGGGAVAYRSTSGVFKNNVVGWSVGQAGLWSDADGTQTIGWNDFWENAGGATGGELEGIELAASNIDDEPQLVGYTNNADCTDDSLWPEADSPLIDTGDPDLSDPDGSRSDIGAYGGIEADPTFFRDEDGDGWVAAHDCDDTDGDRYPGNAEVPYDGVDQDCDGADLTDLDEDGFDGGSGPDCDDDDPTIHPAADEIWYDGVDQDCDGTSDFDQDRDGYDSEPIGADCDDTTPAVNPEAFDDEVDGRDWNCDGVDGPLPSEGCGCATAPTLPAGVLLLLPLLGVRRRR